MRADLQILEGEVLYEKLGAETCVRAFRVADLPLTPAERFAALFRERPRWEWKDLEPYIRYVHHSSFCSCIVEFSNTHIRILV
jgi:sister chromatid cohesion protein DCC1